MALVSLHKELLAQRKVALEGLGLPFNGPDLSRRKLPGRNLRQED